jgi:D-threonine aldolase
MLAQCQAPDVLLAYQPTGPKLQRFISLIKKYASTQFSCLTDNIGAATEQSMAFETAALCIPVCIDLNVGMNRTGILPNEKALELAAACHSLPGIQLKGLHAYDGHIRDIVFATKKEKCDRAYEQVIALNNQLLLPVIIMGGSPSFSVHCKRDNIECSPGTFVYWDKGYSNLCPEQNFLPAAVLVTRVISLPAADKICLDLGHKSVAAENEISCRVFFLNAPELQPISQSEEHLIVAAPETHTYKTGSIVYALPFHICPTVALYEKVFTCENGTITGSWQNIARNRTLTI